MMSAIVIRDGAGVLLAFGPNNGMYDPGIPAGATKSMEPDYEVVLAEWQAAQTPKPDYIGFLHWLDANLSFTQIQAFQQYYGMFVAWCQFRNSARVQEAILDAKLNHPELMTPAVYALFRQAVTDHHIPVVLP